MPEPTNTSAGNLGVAHLGCVIRFDWALPHSHIAAVLTGRLWGIEHTPNASYIRVAHMDTDYPDDDANESLFELGFGDILSVYPPDIPDIHLPD